MTPCKYNTVIDCDAQHCETCGWSPKVAEERLAAIEAGQAVQIKKTRKVSAAKRVAKIDADGKVIEVYSSIRIAAAENGVSRDSVQARCEGTTTRFTLDLGGCTFRYY